MAALTICGTVSSALDDAMVQRKTALLRALIHKSGSEGQLAGC
ncbi:hypothetical protein RSSM_05011 [Rhodopirellula sallentina SM41]|uniref:Uncharacterized protein n=1 Tax=Rhodopirellula sallentina SM41 TaxID=1263870 RepID=M5TWK3_9BACT|nr:hypothetical protein RSSM_05011 [Rhodopirellula sallentina SM41]